MAEGGECAVGKRAVETDDAGVTAGEGPAKRAATVAESPAVDAAEEQAKVEAVVNKLLGFVDNEKKLVRAQGVICKAVAAVTNAASAECYLPLVTELEKRRDLKGLRKNRELFEAYSKIFAALDEMAQHLNPTSRYVVETAVFRYRLEHELQTDDSFRFAAAAKRVQQCLDELPWAFRDSLEDAEGSKVPNAENKPLLSLAQKTDRCAVLCQLLELQLARWHQAFVRAALEQSARTGAAHRLLFPEAERERLDQINDAIRANKSKGTLHAKKTAGGPRNAGSYGTWTT
ncbi:uncharacterized protein MONBRDRAFT_26915 [Monosiga brevicollis MX1]|uniref:Uncharacterized protein n=1 Tax=Monosiga brevicollis TaxID=81824 RepID=A9V3W9_MONBE|nr:uncharacterized protein MONBRDRAFT_26915 [Monosiga brevicollis MX1]EDQ87877.1 predicted protein [Monosiga brevicollis MX1]|eukprot:XP_001747410.1 hypothetical protein [Monosiga brevicollis MX1]